LTRVVFFFLCIDFHVYGGGANHKRENHAPGQACQTQTAKISGPSCNCALKAQATYRRAAAGYK